MSKCTCQIVPTGDMTLGRPDFRIERCEFCLMNQKIAESAREVVKQFKKGPQDFINGKSADAVLADNKAIDLQFWKLVRASLPPDQAQGEPNA